MECIDGKKKLSKRKSSRFGQAPRACIAPYDSGVSRRSRALSFRPDLGGRNDFRNMINCPAVAFRRRGGFHADCGGYFSAVVSLRGLSRDTRKLVARFSSLCIPRASVQARMRHEEMPKSKTFLGPSISRSTIAIYQTGELINQCHVCSVNGDTDYRTSKVK